jgi:glycerophosphoryl diester phosphodiesterase
MIEGRTPKLVAHRGYMEIYPENTWAGLEAAVRTGACWIEFDLQMCSDRRFVLLHDADFRRTANLPLSVFDIGSQQLAEISVHEPARLGSRYAPLPVPDLDSVLLKLSVFENLRAMVEIKQESLDRWGMERVMDALVEKLDSYRNQCVVIAYNHSALDYARKKSSLEIGWILDVYDQQHLRRAKLLEPQFLICNATKIPPQQKPWTGPWQWMIYDINDAAVALQWGARGVELIETRDIGAMLQDPQLATQACPHAL